MTLSIDTKRRLLFLLGCIPTRILLAYGVSRLSPQHLRMTSYVAFIVAFAFIYLVVSGTRKSGAETFGKPIWWTPHMRIIHATFYVIFGYMAFQKNPNAYLILYVDALVGLLAFLMHEFFN